MNNSPTASSSGGNNIDLNYCFSRTHIISQIRDILQQFDAQSTTNSDFKKGIYIYGAPGSGKTRFALDILAGLNYDVIKYDAGDVRNKALIDTITSDNVSKHNVLDMMFGRVKKIAILMDEIDGMHKGDKGGISALVKLIRQKKTKKQKSENATLNPVICIGNYYMDKKIKELMKVCHVFELPTPTNKQIHEVLGKWMPKLDPALHPSAVQYVQGDIRKLEFLHKLYLTKPEILTEVNMQHIFHSKYYNEDYCKITQLLFDGRVPIHNQMHFMNDNDRTTVALLWHENLADRVALLPATMALPLYLRLIDNICVADYIDRITFQHQIWLFNEMSTFIKTFYNNYLFHGQLEKMEKDVNLKKCVDAMRNIDTIRFTKILTKYSTEYSNQTFLYALCQEMDLDKKDVIAFFQEMRAFYGKEMSGKTECLADIECVLADTNVKKLDVKRIFRYLDKNVKRDNVVKEDDDDDEEGILGDDDEGDDI